MYDSFISAQNRSFVEAAINAFKAERSALAAAGSFWVVYGSFALNTQQHASDMDVLYVHDSVGSNPNPIRIQSSFRGYPVTIYSISRASLGADGEERLYGGYFAGKLLNPNVLINATEADRQLVMQVAGEFIAPFAADAAGKRTVSTAENLLADTVIARFRLCPWYESYFVRYFTSQNFDALWRHMRSLIADCLLASGYVRKFDDGGFEYCRKLDTEELHIQMIQATARFWSLGACLHNCQADFPDYYIQKALQTVRQRNLEDSIRQMKVFLKEKQG